MFRISLSTGLIALGLSTAGTLAAPQVLVNENFATDPVAGGRAVIVGDNARVTYSPGQSTLAIDSNSANVQAIWSLPHALTDAWNFSMSATFTIAPGYVADPEGYAQLVSFGLLNSATTGSNRSSGPAFTDPATTYDLVSVDYFPNSSAYYSSLTLAPAAFGTQPLGSTDAFDVINFPYGPESLIDNTAQGEIGPLASSLTYTATLAYNALTRMFALTLADDTGLLNINAGGGADTDVTTIQLALPGSIAFNVDQLGLFAWQDHFDQAGWTTPGLPSALGSVSYSSLYLQAEQIPEPASLSLIAIGACTLFIRRR